MRVLLLAAVIAVAFAALSNEKVERTLNLESQLVVETLALSVKNNGPAPVSTYTLSFDAGLTASAITAKVRDHPCVVLIIDFMASFAEGL